MININRTLQVQVLQLAWPVILEMSGVMLTGVLTTAMVGRLGAVALSAVGIATMVQAASAMIISAFGTGASALVGRASGAGNWPEVRRTAGQAILIGFLLGSLLGIVGYLGAGSLFGAIGLAPEAAEAAGRVLATLFLFTPALLLMSICNSVLRGVAKTRLAFFIGVFSNLLSLLLAWLLIFGVGLPKLGMMGAAWSAGIAQLAGGAAALTALARDESIRLQWRDILTWRRDVIDRIMDISLPAAMEQAALQGGRMTFTFMLSSVGAIQFAAHQIALQVESLSFLPGFGFSVAIMTLVAQSLGKKRPREAARLVRATGWLSILTMTGMAVVFVLFAEPLTALFIADPEVIYWGTWCVMLAALEQPTLAVTYILAGALRGAGDTRWPMYVTVFSVWFVRLPLVYLCVKALGMNIAIAWAITALDYLVRSLILWRRYRTGSWQKIY